MVEYGNIEKLPVETENKDHSAENHRDFSAMCAQHGNSEVASELVISEDGVACIGNIMYRPTSMRGCRLAYDDNVTAVKSEKDENLYACFDVFNTDGQDFCAHLDLFYDQGGYISLTEQRQNDAGQFEVRITDVPARLFVDEEVFSKNRKLLTTKMLEYGKKLHDRNKNDADEIHWKQMDDNMKLLPRSNYRS